jgi:very-short-patch-repair endonuclease
VEYKNPKLIEVLIARAREFRKQPTAAEELLWQQIRNRALGGFKFRRQQPIDQFIVDFFCLETKLVVEVDGEIHETQREYDQARQEHLEARGLRVIRFSNVDVMDNMDAVKEAIFVACSPHPDDLQNIDAG